MNKIQKIILSFFSFICLFPLFFINSRDHKKLFFIPILIIFLIPYLVYKFKFFRILLILINIISIFIFLHYVLAGGFFFFLILIFSIFSLFLCFRKIFWPILIINIGLLSSGIYVLIFSYVLPIQEKNLPYRSWYDLNLIVALLLIIPSLIYVFLIILEIKKQKNLEINKITTNINLENK